jgi:hypothetical protein
MPSIKIKLSKKRRGKKPSALEKLSNLVGKGDSGIPDLATNRKYMEGIGQWRE